MLNHIEADTFFPSLNMDEWKTIEAEDHMDDEPLFTYVTLKKIDN